MTAAGQSRKRPVAGFHPGEWSAELIGTALLILGGLSAVTFDFAPHSPMTSLIPSHSWRLLVTGTLFASTGALVTISPLGRLSGAHLNPAVTLGMWLEGKVHTFDLFGYVTAQCLGAMAGAELVRRLWGQWALSVNVGLTQPGSGFTPADGAVTEAGMTALLVLVIFYFVSSTNTMRWTPLAVLVVVAAEVWRMAPYTGTSLNPARSLGPAVVIGDWHYYWVYVVGPLSGSILAFAVWSLVPRAVLTGKLFHDSRYRTIFASLVPTREAPTGSP